MKETLQKLFLPIAPSIKIISASAKDRFNTSEVTPSDKNGFNTVTWQHSGIELQKPSVYKSARLNRRKVSDESQFATITYQVNASNYRDKEFSLKAKVKIVDGSGSGHVWARVDREGNKMGFFENMDNRPIKGNEWDEYEIKGKVDSDGLMLFFGCFLRGDGKLFTDNIQLSFLEEGEWRDVYKNDFESDALFGLPTGMINNEPPNYSIAVTDEDAAEGSKAVTIFKKSEAAVDLLFDKHCQVGEYFRKEIGSGLAAVVPLALYGNDEYTYPKADPVKLEQLRKELEAITDISGNDLSTRLGSLVITWNIFQHFYPYFDIARTDWNKDFNEAIKEAFSNQTADDFLKILRKLTAKLKDGHVRVTLNGSMTETHAFPFEWEWIENELVITNTFSDSVPLNKGDIVRAIDGQSPKQYFENVHLYISAATSGWLDMRSKTSAFFGPENSAVRLTVINEKQVAREEVIRRSMHTSQYYGILYGNSGEMIREIHQGTYYINISTASMEDIRRTMANLEKADNIICDLRGYPKSNHELINHLLTIKDTSTSWMQIPQIIYPDQEKITGYQNHGWKLSPASPHLTAKIFFLIDGRAISYAESYMSFIEHYKLATIIGQPTAGTNGNVNPFMLPGGYRISWTGMKVLKHNGSQLHGVGIIPDVYVTKTIKGIRENRDEFLETALKLAGKK